MQNPLNNPDDVVEALIGASHVAPSDLVDDVAAEAIGKELAKRLKEIPKVIPLDEGVMPHPAVIIPAVQARHAISRSLKEALADTSHPFQDLPTEARRLIAFAAAMLDYSKWLEKARDAGLL